MQLRCRAKNAIFDLFRPENAKMAGKDVFVVFD
jgi:hypothetical protein